MKTIGKSLNARVPTAALFLDMSKAFDFVCYKRLLAELYNSGIRGPAYNLIKNYLNNGTQCVEIIMYNKSSKCTESYRSSYKRNNFGVPQGSVLGPLLFLLYINDLPSIVSHECILFADDTTIVVKGNRLAPETLEREVGNALKNVVEWLSVNNLKVNLQKTKCMQFYTHCCRPQSLNIILNGKKIEDVRTTKFLGITLDSNCNWRDHIDSLCSKINRFIFALRRVSQVVSKEAAITAYNSYVGSALRYGIIVWGNSSDLKKAFIIQKRCIRSIFGLDQLDSCEPYFRQYKLLTLPCLYIMEMCLFAHKHKDLFRSNSEVSTRTLRNQYRNKLYNPAGRLELVSKNSFFMCIRIYNKLPEAFTVMKMNKFRITLKTWLAERCFYEVKKFFDEM